MRRRRMDSKTESCAVAAWHWQASASASGVGAVGDSGVGLGLQLPNWAFSLSSGRAFLLCNELGYWGYVVRSRIGDFGYQQS